MVKTAVSRPAAHRNTDFDIARTARGGRSPPAGLPRYQRLVCQWADMTAPQRGVSRSTLPWRRGGRGGRATAQRAERLAAPCRPPRHVLLQAVERRRSLWHLGAKGLVIAATGLADGVDLRLGRLLRLLRRL